MKAKVLSFIIFSLIGFGTFSCTGTTSPVDDQNLFTYEPSENTTNEFLTAVSPEDMAVRMGKGTNLGNILEMADDQDWVIHEEEIFFDDFQTAGFENVRIPVSWGNHIDEMGNIDPEFMSRVEKTVDWSLDRGFVTIINAHHEGWVYNDYQNNIEKFETVWTQIADRFQYKSENLVFEIFNEPRDPMGTAECNDMNSRILPIIREKNPERIVIIGGTNWGNFAQLMEIDVPEDSYLMGQFHYYIPHDFTHNNSEYWGTTEEIASVRDNMDQLTTWADNNNITLYCGEFGVMHANDDMPRDMDSTYLYYETVTEVLVENGIPFSVWDDSGWFGIYDRNTRTFNSILDYIFP